MAKKLTFSLAVDNKEKAKVLEALIKSISDEKKEENHSSKKSS